MKKILLIENESVILLAISIFLKRQDFEVIEATEGLTGLELAKKQQPDLILCDINMPQLDGYRVLEELRTDLITSKIPFIFISSEPCPPNCRRALQLGANDYLTKPLENRELLEAITIQLNKINSI
jgi:CheY-like chemotaxis protein